MKPVIATLLVLLPLTLWADSSQRWINAAPVLVRAQGRADAAVIGRLQQATPVTLLSQDPASGYCELLLGEGRQGHVACRFLSETAVPPRRAGEGGVPAERRWSVGSGLLLRAAPEPQAAVIARLPLNSELSLLAGRSGGPGYCEVQTLAIGPVPAQQGHTACALIAESPLLLQRLEQAYGSDGKPNPDFNPRKLFAITPSWESLGRYQSQQQALCNAAERCPARDADFATELARMRQLLHGQRITQRDLMPDLPLWREFDGGPEHRGQGPTQPLAQRLPLPLPPAEPSWFRSGAELAGPQASLAQLAQHFDAEQQWFVGALFSPRPEDADARFERLTRKLHRIELLSDGSLRTELHTPQWVNRGWQPDLESMCHSYLGDGFAFGDTDAATRQRNGFAPQAGLSAQRRLFSFYSSRPLPPGPSSTDRQTLALDRQASGFVKGELRRIDVDADGRPDLIWFEGTGRGPGHIEGPPKHDDPWWRLLLVNLDGQWRVLGTDAISYGCGC